MKKNSKNSNKLISYVLSVVAVVSLGYWLYTKLVNPTQVALIGDQAGIIPSPTCASNLVEFSASKSCSESGFSLYTFSCVGGSMQTLSTTGSCLGYYDAYTKAESICGQTCTAPPPRYSPMASATSTSMPSPSLLRPPSPPLSPSPHASVKVSPTPASPSPKPTPTPPPGCYWKEPMFCIQLFGHTCPNTIACPSPTASPISGSAKPVASAWPPTPPPTADPSALVSCETEVYKFPGGNVPALMTAESLASYKVNPDNQVAKEGDVFGFNIKLTNAKRYAHQNGNLKLTAWTEILSGQSAFSVTSAGQTCETGFSDGSVRCSVPQLKMNIGQTVRPETFEIAKISNVKSPQQISVAYKGIYSASTLTCPPVTLKIVPAQNCYNFWRLKVCRPPRN